MTMNERINEIIKSRKGLSQKGLAEHLGLNPSTVNNWLAARMTIPTKQIVGIAEYLCVSPNYLLTGEETGVTLSEEDSEWLSMIHQMPEGYRTVLHEMMADYLKENA